MFAKVFAQIFDSSISEDYMVRHIFMDLLVLADQEGIVDMTLTAISRRTNVPPELISRAIERLMENDSTSRSSAEDGRRLGRLDSHRNWGWYIVNWDKYRNMRDEEARKSYFREYQRKRRAGQRAVKDRVLTGVDKSDKVELLNDVTHTEAEADTETKKHIARGTRLSKEFAPSSSHEVIANERHLSLSAELASFRDHFTSAPGQRGVKLDWDATFRNWLRSSRNVVSNGFKPTTTPDLIPIDPETGKPLVLRRT
jgi:hypothetical protein